MAVSPQWRGPSNIHAFVLLGQPYRPGFAAVVFVIETWRLGPLENGFPSKRYHAARVGGKNRERWGWFAE